MRNSLQGAAVALIVLGLSACAKPADPVAEAPVENAAAAPAGEPGAAAPSAANPTATYACEGKTVTATFDNSGEGSVSLQLGAERLVLPTAVAASGARYADKAGNEFWEHQGEATLTLAGGKPQQCREAAAGG
ncbi:MAG TPA: MliC family protein [Stenotrophomonas sp.]|jgi:membrane-bound inhibitor of C-type lysozyme